MNPSDSSTAPAQVPIVEFDEVREAWRNPHLTCDIKEAGEHLFHEGTVNRTDGEAHVARRRAMSRLLGRQGHKAFRDKILFPTIDDGLRHVLARRDPDGYARLDLLQWARRQNFVLAAALAGYDGMDDRPAADELFELWTTFTEGRPSSYQQTVGTSDTRSAGFQAAVRCRQAIFERYYTPSLRRRQALVAKVAAGQMPESELPHDLLTLIVQQLDPRWADPALAERETLFLLNVGVRTTAASLCWVLRELFAWLDKHPEDRPHLREESFLLQAAGESLRLHPVAPGFPRLADQEVRLCAGTAVPNGALGVICAGPANVAAHVWGPDAAEFNPHRIPPAGVDPFGFAFGWGPHACYGKPLVLGNEGLDGSLIYFLKTLMAARIEPDPDKPHRAPLPRGVFEDVAQYHVRFPN